MSHDFFTAMRIEDDERLIDAVAVASSKTRYSILAYAPWTLRAQVLATGLVFPGLKEFIKNGRRPNKRRNLTEIKGYPLIVKNRTVSLPLLWKKLTIPDETILEGLPEGSCLVKLNVKLQTPFHSRDDISFYPTDNVLKRDHLFHVPYLGASGIKGLLRWAWRICWQDRYNGKDELEPFLFGPRPGECAEDSARQGCLYTWPLFWNGTVGEDIINPQDRESNSGKDPVRYEVVKTGATGVLSFMLLNSHGSETWADTVDMFIGTLDYLVEYSGLSAKRTSGWGNIEVTGRSAWVAGIEQAEEQEERTDASATGDIAALWKEVCDENGNLLPENDPAITKKRLSKLTGKSPKQCTGKKRASAYRQLENKYREFQEQLRQQAEQGEEDEKAPVQAVPRRFADMKEMVSALKGLEG